MEFRYSVEDVDNYPGILTDGTYHVVVGNPPYVTVGDNELNKTYRAIYDACAGTYALSVPFAQQFFELARPAATDGRGAGYVGQITANSFMKREFGKKLVTDFFGLKVELTRIIDTSSAFIPGHGTPTVILIGRRRRFNRSRTIRAVLGIRGEPSAPLDPSRGYVWSAILDQFDRAGSETAWVSARDVDRSLMSTHPWSLSGGVATELSSSIVSATKRKLKGRVVKPIGRAIRAGADEAFIRPLGWAHRAKVNPGALRPLLVGERVRDWGLTADCEIWYPYEAMLDEKGLTSELWAWRQVLAQRRTFQGTMVDAGLHWWEYMQHTRSAYATPLSITFAFVATHNHFVLDRGGKVFNRSAPVIKLAEGASEEAHLELLGVLNSSTACFWLKQVSHDKGSQSGTGGFMHDEWERFYEFTGTKLQEFPLPAAYPLELARQVDAAGQRLNAVSPAGVASSGVPTAARLRSAEAEWTSTRARMIALQEELDWQVYHLYGLADDLTAPAAEVPELNLGERAFEIVLARKVDAGEEETSWFARHHSVKTTTLPTSWSPAYRAVVERRIALMTSNRSIALIERPECKRRWYTDGWDDLRQQALRDWLLDRCESRALWYAPDENGLMQPRPLSTSQLADELRRDADFVAVADHYDPGRDLAAILADLVDKAHVPYLPVLRYTDSGLAKRADWEAVWKLQRDEDAAKDERDKRAIRERTPVPPKYSQADFRKTTYWSNRGKLDVPKERFISYPHAGRDGDPSLLLGWAGWDHQEQAQVLAVLAVQREQEDGWPAQRLAPLLSGLREVLPWVRQWHRGFDPRIADDPAEVYPAFLAERMNALHLTDGDLDRWRPSRAR